MRSRRLTSILLLAALLVALPAAAAPVRSAPAFSFWDGVRVLLARLLPIAPVEPKNCSTMDPNGRCLVAPVPLADNCSTMDPNGGCKP